MGVEFALICQDCKTYIWLHKLGTASQWYWEWGDPVSISIPEEGLADIPKQAQRPLEPWEREAFFHIVRFLARHAGHRIALLDEYAIEERFDVDFYDDFKQEWKAL